MATARTRVGACLGVVGCLLLGGLALVSPAPAVGAGDDLAGRCRSGYVALTFDDGPAGATGRLVRILREARVPATFFMVGQRVAAAGRLARRVERAGLLIGNHSWAHRDMTTQTSTEVEATLRVTDAVLRRAGTHPTRLMRPPYGALDDAARAGIRAAGFVPVLWTVDSRDWAGGTASQIARRILAGLRPNGSNIVLQHDGVARSPVSVDAVPLVIRGARSRGYCFTALDERGRPGFPTPDASVSVTNSREGDEALATIRLSKPPGRPTSVVLRTHSGSATAGKDVERIMQRVSIPAGDLAVQVPIRVPRDGSDESTERFAVSIDRPHGVRIAEGTAIARIEDVDRPPRINGVDLAVVEPANHATPVDVRFRLPRASGKSIIMVFATRPGTADAMDYTPMRLRTELAPGQNSVLVPLGVLADDLDETEETFTVEVIRARRVRTGRPATVTILPPPPPQEPGQKSSSNREPAAA
jgi:peptidoglycan/xylan/chitin deacetylase (PgdA/CDA1 family)